MSLAPNYTLGDFAAAAFYWLRLGKGTPNGDGDAEFLERLGIVVHDRRHEVRDKDHSRGRARPERPWSQIFGTTTHQTASGHLHPGHNGVLSLPAHIEIHTDASVSLLHPLAQRQPHAHALNGPTAGIEVDCRVDGIEGDASTFWRSKAEIDGWRRNKLGRKVKFVGIRTREQLRVPVSDKQLNVLDMVQLYCHAAFIVNAPPEHHQHWGCYTHRQGDDSRTSDPGSRIARRIEQLRREMGWKDVSQETYGSGRPQPPEWLRP